MATDVIAALDNDARALSGLSEPALIIELGRRLSLTERQLNSHEELTTVAPQGPVAADESLAGPLDFVENVGRQFLRRFNGQLYSLCCDAEDPENTKVKTALDLGIQAGATALAAVLVATFGWLPGIASVITVIIVKRFGDAIYDTACQLWKDEL